MRKKLAGLAKPGLCPRPRHAKEASHEDFSAVGNQLASTSAAVQLQRTHDCIMQLPLFYLMSEGQGSTGLTNDGQIETLRPPFVQVPVPEFGEGSPQQCQLHPPPPTPHPPHVGMTENVKAASAYFKYALTNDSRKVLCYHLCMMCTLPVAPGPGQCGTVPVHTCAFVAGCRSCRSLAVPRLRNRTLTCLVRRRS
jgi:hypothetical protein